MTTTLTMYVAVNMLMGLFVLDMSATRPVYVTFMAMVRFVCR